MSVPISYCGKKLTGWKTALHSHTTRSDGESTPEEILEIYEKHGYDVFCFTDHRKSAPVSQWKSSMLLIPGMEFHPAGPRGITWHIVSYGIPEELEDLSALPVQDGIDKVVELGGLCHAAHPAWSEIRSTDILPLKNIIGFEIYNSVADEIGRADSTQTMLELWSAGRLLAPLGVDDIHHRSIACLAWTMVMAEKRDRESILAALKNGMFYASTGPEFYRIEFDGLRMRADFSPCRQVFIQAPQWYSYSLQNPSRLDRVAGKDGTYSS